MSSTGQVTKCFYVFCNECHYGEVEFDKKTAERFAKNHVCETYLKRRLYNGNKTLADNFEVTVSRRTT